MLLLLACAVRVGAQPTPDLLRFRMRALSQATEGVELPTMGMGLVCRNKVKCSKLAASVEAFLRMGGRLLDTAPTYGKGLSQRLLGAGLRASGVPRAHVWIQTKIPVASMGYAATLHQVNTSLKAMGLSYLDCVMVHRANTDGRAPAKGARGARATALITRKLRLETWRALQEARRLGLVRFAGVSNFGVAYLNELAEAGLPQPHVNELEFNPWVGARQRELVAECQRRGIRVVGYNSLGSAGAAGGAVRRLAAARNATEAQLLLRYSLDHGAAVIPTSSSPGHMRDNLHAVRIAPLSPSEWALLEASPRPHDWRSFALANDPFRAEGFACDSADEFASRLRRAMATVRNASGPTRVLDASHWPTAGLCKTATSGNGTAASRLGEMLERSRQPFIVLPNFLAPATSAKLVRALQRRYPINNTYVTAGKPGLGGDPEGNSSYCPIHDDGVARDNKNGDMRCEGKNRCDYWLDTTACQRVRTGDFLSALTRSYFRRFAPQLDGWTPEPGPMIASLVRGRGSNSGGSWHQDESSVGWEWPSSTDDIGPQVKCLAYLTDTHSWNAPFTMLLDYDASEMARRVERPDFKRRVHRFAEATIRDVAQRSPAFVLEILAPAGSVVCFESGSVHHGKLLDRGERYSFTLYFSAPVGKNAPRKKNATKAPGPPRRRKKKRSTL